MKIACVADTHCGFPKIPEEVDMVIHAGDFSYRGSEIETVNFLKWFESLPNPHRVFISGNHDFMQEDFPDKFDMLLKKHAPTCINLNDSSVEIEGLKIHGSPVQPYFGGWAFNRNRGKEIAEHWDLIPEKTDILITHGPPYKILDLTHRSYENVGCFDLMKKVKEIKPRLHIFGHIHEGYGKIEEDGITFVNASQMTLQYQLLNPPIIVEL